MDKDQIQQLKLQVNEARRWFYLGARDVLGVDITGIPLPRHEITVIGGFHDSVNPDPEYDYLELTPYDLAQQEAAVEKAWEPKPSPKIYEAMGNLFWNAVQYLEARQSVADGEQVSGMPTREKNLLQALEKVEEAAKSPPFPQARQFVEEVVQHARVVQRLATSNRPVTYEMMELMMEQEREASRISPDNMPKGSIRPENNTPDSRDRKREL